MTAKSTSRNLFSTLRRKPGPAGWQARAAEALGYSRAHISRVQNGKVKSPAALAALKAWKKKNGIAA